VTLALLTVALALRLLAWQRQPELTYDGAYYLRHAERLARFDYDFTGFPPGYPLAVLALRPLAGEPVRAARLVSLLCGLATIVIVHRSTARSLPPAWAAGATLFLAVHPHLSRVHVETMTEPLYGLLVVAALALDAGKRCAAAAACLGFAFLVRPEAMLLLAVLTLARARALRRLPWQMLWGWVPVAAYALAASLAVGQPVLSPKQMGVDLGPAFLVRTRAMLTAVHTTFPWPLLVAALVFAARRRRLWLWVAVPIVVLPLPFVVHVQERLLLPALPFWAVLGLEWIRSLAARARVAALAVSFGLFVVGAAPGYRNLVAPDPISPHARAIGTALRPHLGREDRVACRFPLIPYFAGAGFVRPTALPYDALLDSLRADRATHLAVVEDEMVRALPQLARLFDDPRFATAEGRLEPVTRVDVGPGQRAILYRFVAPAVASAPAVARTAGGAGWHGTTLVVAGEDGDLHAIGPPDVVLTATAELETEPHAGPARLVFCQARGGERWIAALDGDGRLTRWESTGADDPASPADLGSHVVYVRRRAPAGLRCIDVATGRVAGVRLAGLGDASARALAVTARGNDVAITYQTSDAKRPADRIIAVATWPAAAPGSAGGVELSGRWAVGLGLADDSVCFAPFTDLLLIALDTGDAQRSSPSIAVVRSDATLRRLTFGFTAARAPRLGADGKRLAFTTDVGTVRVATLPPDALSMPRPLVFPPAKPSP
jgi:hypothetical protein